MWQEGKRDHSPNFATKSHAFNHIANVKLTISKSSESTEAYLLSYLFLPKRNDANVLVAETVGILQPITPISHNS